MTDAHFYVDAPTALTFSNRTDFVTFAHVTFFDAVVPIPASHPIQLRSRESATLRLRPGQYHITTDGDVLVYAEPCR